MSFVKKEQIRMISEFMEKTAGRYWYLHFKGNWSWTTWDKMLIFCMIKCKNILFLALFSEFDFFELCCHLSFIWKKSYSVALHHKCWLAIWLVLTWWPWSGVIRGSPTTIFYSTLQWRYPWIPYNADSCICTVPCHELVPHQAWNEVKRGVYIRANGFCTVMSW